VPAFRGILLSASHRPTSISFRPLAAGRKLSADNADGFVIASSSLAHNVPQAT
jgi:hypothetical protein